MFIGGIQVTESCNMKDKRSIRDVNRQDILVKAQKERRVGREWKTRETPLLAVEDPTSERVKVALKHWA